MVNAALLTDMGDLLDIASPITPEMVAEDEGSGVEAGSRYNSAVRRHAASHTEWSPRALPAGRPAPAKTCSARAAAVGLSAARAENADAAPGQLGEDGPPDLGNATATSSTGRESPIATGPPTVP